MREDREYFLDGLRLAVGVAPGKTSQIRPLGLPHLEYLQRPEPLSAVTTSANEQLGPLRAARLSVALRSYLGRAARSGLLTREVLVLSLAVPLIAKPWVVRR
jgi:hypothetical protein